MFEKTPLFAESWNVAFRNRPSGTIFDDQKTPFTVIPNSFRYWAADPFIFEHEGIKYIFAELFDYVLCRGCIGYCTLKDGQASSWTKVLQESFHLSYPFIFHKNNEIYMMPESGTDQSLCIYHAEHFPDKWKKIEVLRKNMVLGDTTLLNDETGNHALTYDLSDPHEIQLKLLDLHNPGKDTRLQEEHIERKRPAGKFFSMGGRLYRPAQDCSMGYGKGLIFYECVPAPYREKLIKKIYPHELQFSSKIFLDGMHTYNADSEYEIIDIKTRRFNLLNLVFRMFGKIRGVFW